MPSRGCDETHLRIGFLRKRTTPYGIGCLDSVPRISSPYRLCSLSTRRRRTDERLSQDLRGLESGSGGFLAQRGRRDRLVETRRPDLRQDQRPRPLVRRSGVQYLLQLRRPPCRRRTGRTVGDRLRQPGHRCQGGLHLCRTAARGGGFRRRARRRGRRQGRPGYLLYAHGPRGCHRHAGLRAARRGPFRRLWRLRREGTGGPHRGRRAETDPRRILRHRAGAHRRIQAAAGPSDRIQRPQAGALRRPPARAGARRDDRGTRQGLGRARRSREGGGQDGRLRERGGDRSALRPLHLRHHRPAQGCCAR